MTQQLLDAPLARLVACQRSSIIQAGADALDFGQLLQELLSDVGIENLRDVGLVVRRRFFTARTGHCEGCHLCSRNRGEPGQVVGAKRAGGIGLRRISEGLPNWRVGCQTTPDSTQVRVQGMRSSRSRGIGFPVFSQMPKRSGSS